MPARIVPHIDSPENSFAIALVVCLQRTSWDLTIYCESSFDALRISPLTLRISNHCPARCPGSTRTRMSNLRLQLVEVLISQLVLQQLATTRDQQAFGDLDTNQLRRID